MKSRKSDNQTSRTPSQAINIVLKTEQEAESDIEQCRKKAADTINNARSKAAQIARRTNNRITNIHLRSKQRLSSVVAEMERSAGNELRQAEAVPIDKNRITRAMRKVAAILVDSATERKPG